MIEQVTHDTRLWLVASGANITDGQIVVHTQVAFDEARDLPVLARPIIALEDEDVAARRGASVARAPTLVVGVGERRTDGTAQRQRITGLGRADPIRQTSFFHSASRSTA